MLKPQFTMLDINSRIAEAQKNIRFAVLQSLRYVGEEFIAQARRTDTYKDHTGNLRNSIGFIILEEGQIIAETFDGSGAGQANGKALAREIATRYSDFEGYVLVVVAGMEYAAAVESKGFDVLTGSTFQAEDTLQALLGNIRNKVR